MTNPITPQEAQQLLDESAPGPWEIEDYDGYPEDGGGGAYLDVDLENEYNLALASVAPDLAATIAADTIQYGIHIEFPDQQFMHPILGHRGAWTTDKALVEHDLSGLRENDQLRDANIRLVARRVSPTWEIKE